MAWVKVFGPLVPHPRLRWKTSKQDVLGGNLRSVYGAGSPHTTQRRVKLIRAIAQQLPYGILNWLEEGDTQTFNEQHQLSSKEIDAKKEFALWSPNIDTRGFFSDRLLRLLYCVQPEDILCAAAFVAWTFLNNAIFLLSLVARWGGYIDWPAWAHALVWLPAWIAMPFVIWKVNHSYCDNGQKIPNYDVSKYNSLWFVVRVLAVWLAIAGSAALVSLKIDAAINGSWLTACMPWIIVEAVFLLRRVFSVIVKRLSPFDMLAWTLVRLTTIVLVVLWLDGYCADVDWYVVWTPFCVASGAQFLRDSLRGCDLPTSSTVPGIFSILLMDMLGCFISWLFLLYPVAAVVVCTVISFILFISLLCFVISIYRQIRETPVDEEDITV